MKTDNFKCKLKFLVLLVSIILFYNIKIVNAQIKNNFNKYIDENGWYDLTNSGLKINIDSVFIILKDSFGLQNSDNMKIELIEIDKKDKTKKKILYQQYYKKYKVEDANFIVHGKNGIVKRMHGNVIHSLNIDVTNPIGEKDALKKALSFINAKEYAWDNEE